MESIIGGTIPPLRQDLEMTPITHEGRPLVLLSDLLGLDEESLAVSPAVAMIASLFDGQKRAADIAADLAAQKALLSEAEIQSLADQLAKHGLLDTPEAREKRRRLLKEFSQSPRRAFRAKARGLPENPLEFGAFLGGFYKAPKGPGEEPPPTVSGTPPLGLVSPHIDFFRGGPLYAWAYLELAKHPPPDVVVALGVAHLSPRSPWVLTRKAYETPHGPLEVDESLYEEIRGALWYDPLEEEWVHAKEHSLEFQALWLKYLWRKDAPKWVPILCSSYERYCTDRPPSSVPTIEGALEKIGRALRARRERGQRVLILAGVDLAHVGRRFGDDRDVTPELQKEIETLDRASLEKALALDADAFFRTGTGDGAWRKVCGLSALYTSLRWIKALSNGKTPAGRLLAYGQAPDPAGGVVSFVSAVFEEGAG